MLVDGKTQNSVKFAYIIMETYLMLDKFTLLLLTVELLCKAQK